MVCNFHHICFFKAEDRIFSTIVSFCQQHWVWSQNEKTTHCKLHRKARDSLLSLPDKMVVCSCSNIQCWTLDPTLTIPPNPPNPRLWVPYWSLWFSTQLIYALSNKNENHPLLKLSFNLNLLSREDIENLFLKEEVFTEISFQTNPSNDSFWAFEPVYM